MTRLWNVTVLALALLAAGISFASAQQPSDQSGTTQSLTGQMNMDPSQTSPMGTNESGMRSSGPGTTGMNMPGMNQPGMTMPGMTMPGMPPTSAMGPTQLNTNRPEAQPRTYFQMARQHFASGDYTATQSDLLKGAAMMRYEAAGATGNMAERLYRAISRVEEAGIRIGRGNMRDQNQLNQTLGEASQALSEYYYDRARTMWQPQQGGGAMGTMGTTETTPMQPGQSGMAGQEPRERTVGHYLNMAAESLNDAAGFTGHALEGGTRAAVETTRNVAGKMIAGSGWATEEAGDAINKFGSVVREFGRNVTGQGSTGTQGMTSPPATGGAMSTQGTTETQTGSSSQPY